MYVFLFAYVLLALVSPLAVSLLSSSLAVCLHCCRVATVSIRLPFARNVALVLASVCLESECLVTNLTTCLRKRLRELLTQQVEPLAASPSDERPKTLRSVRQSDPIRSTLSVARGPVHGDIVIRLVRHRFASAQSPLSVRRADYRT